MRTKIAAIGQMQAYPWLHLRALQRGYVVQQDTIRQLIKLLDPVGVELRRIRPQRMDFYDKLGPYNIAINGCIDGFSHYVVRMEASRMNYDPKVTADPMGAWEDVQIFPDFFGFARFFSLLHPLGPFTLFSSFVCFWLMAFWLFFLLQIPYQNLRCLI